jgi:hypothetical protein
MNTSSNAPRFFHRYESIGWILAGLLLTALAMTFIDTSAPVEWEEVKCFHLDDTRVSCRRANHE